MTRFRCIHRGFRPLFRMFRVSRTATRIMALLWPDPSPSRRNRYPIWRDNEIRREIRIMQYHIVNIVQPRQVWMMVIGGTL